MLHEGGGWPCAGKREMDAAPGPYGWGKLPSGMGSLGQRWKFGGQENLWCCRAEPGIAVEWMAEDPRLSLT